MGQKNEEAKLLFDGAAEHLGWTSLEPVTEGSMDWGSGTPTPLLTTFGLALAKEFGENEIYVKLKAHAEENYEPPGTPPPGSSPGGSG